MARRRIEVRRHPERGRYDRASVEAVLDAGLVAHVAFVDGAQPFCVPMLYARVAETLYVHGSSASRAVRTLRAGAPACVTVTVLDGLVLARSAFQHSANYRSTMVLGSFSYVEGEAERLAAFEAFVDRLVPGRWGEVRPPDRRELEASAILALAIGEAAAKIRTARRATTTPRTPRSTRGPVSSRSPAASESRSRRRHFREGIPLAPSVRRLLETEVNRNGSSS